MTACSFQKRHNPDFLVLRMRKDVYKNPKRGRDAARRHLNSVEQAELTMTRLDLATWQQSSNHLSQALG